MMNSNQAKQIPLKNFLDALGFRPSKSNPKELWYCSPLRDEKTPSFKVDVVKNVWFDHGIGQGGTIIDFGMHYKHTSNIKEVLSWIAKQVVNKSANLVQTSPAQNVSSKRHDLELVQGSVKQPHTAALLNYAISRGISEQVTKTCFKELNFINHATGKQYFALGLENKSGGFDVRNKYFKGAISPKDFTFYDRGSSEIVVFEGMFDYASWLMLSQDNPKNLDIIILNSLSFHQQAADFIQRRSYEKVYTFFDNNPAAKKAAQSYSALFNERHSSQVGLYAGYGDLNEYLVNTKNAPQLSLI